MPTALRITRLAGEAIVPHLADLARLRIRVFHDFPYLYEGSEAYEREYLQTYVRSPGSVIVLVQDGERVVGASTGMPLRDEVEAFRRPFAEQGMDVERIFYCAESVLLPEYRGRGLGVRFFEEREAHARALGGFDTVCFCGVQRPADHPLRPADYQPLDGFWRRRGYAPRPQLQARFAWRDVGETDESTKTLQFWLKPL